jgi:hypothetical protein
MARYTPGNPPTTSIQALAAYIAAEQRKIAQAMETQDASLSLETLYAAPAKYGNGTIVKADGVTWNPGTGAGVYCYYAGTWNKLG